MRSGSSPGAVPWLLVLISPASGLIPKLQLQDFVLSDIQPGTSSALAVPHVLSCVHRCPNKVVHAIIRQPGSSVSLAHWHGQYTIAVQPFSRQRLGVSKQSHHLLELRHPHVLSRRSAIYRYRVYLVLRQLVYGPDTELTCSKPQDQRARSMWATCPWDLQRARSPTSSTRLWLQLRQSLQVLPHS